MEKAVIVGAARTPFGKFGGALRSFTATDLGAIAVKEVIYRVGIDPTLVNYAYIGQVLSSGCKQLPSRQVTKKGGLPWETPSIAINKLCSSSITAVALARTRICSGISDAVLAGGIESMSNAPHIARNMRWGEKRMGDIVLDDTLLYDGLTDAFYNKHMAVLGSEVAYEYGISREAQDEFSYYSQMKAVDAIIKGRFKEEIVPIPINSKNGDLLIADDECPRPETTIEGLSKLKPVFEAEGTITAGNAPGLNDGGTMVLIMSESKAKELGLEILATIIDHQEVSADAKYIATVPGLATMKLLEKNNLNTSDISLFEVNEAFAAVPLVSGKITNWDFDKVNVDGGAIAIGHPIGASGARILMHLMYALRAREGGYGVACICSGAAQGDAMLIKVE